MIKELNYYLENNIKDKIIKDIFISEDKLLDIKEKGKN